jgi:cyanophycin synthetase
MKILETRVMRGPNQWSATEKNLIVLKLQVQDPGTEVFSDFTEKALELFPDLSERFVSEQSSLVKLAHAVQFIAKELQTRSGMPCIYSRIKATSRSNEYFVIFAYEIEQAGVFAGQTAVNIVNALVSGKAYNISPDLDELARIRSKYNIGPTSNYILTEIKRRGIPFRRFDYGSLMTLGYGVRQRKIRTAVTDSTSGLGIELAGDKDETKRLLAENNVPVPRGILVFSEKELRERIGEVNFPIVIKPLDGNHGRGVTTDVNSIEKAVYAFEIAKRISEEVIVEEYVKGEDYRFLVVNYKLVAVAKRTPAYIIGDGRSTIKQLIDEENLHHERGNSHEHVLAPIKIDGTTKKILAEKELEIHSVLPKGQKLVLKDTANISAGGTAEDVTDIVHPYNVFMVERVARMFNLNICGVDIMTKAVDIPITRDVGAIIEVNAGPGLRMHSNPQKGTPRDIASPIVDMLFPDPSSFRIPVVAVTGTNGKTTTTRLIAHLAKEAGYHPGFCTTDGIYINGHELFKGDCTGSVSAQNVLFDPSIDFAVLECARGGLIRSGLGFDECDVAVVTNITEDHLGLKDIHTIEELTKIKAVVARTVKKDGYAVLNADDDRVYGIKEDLNCKIALFSLDPDSERLQQHIQQNGLAATIENGYVTLFGDGKVMIEEIRKIPLSFDGKAEFMVRNILASVLAGVAGGLDTSSIKKGLLSFIPSPELTPGRMNLFDFGHFKVMVDYAHNTDGFTQVKKFLSQIPDTPKIAVISVAGDRREIDIREVGRIVASVFDEVIIRHNKETRGVGEEDVSMMLLSGVREADPSLKASVIPNERDAIDHAIHNAKKGSFVFVCADKVPDTLHYIHELLYHGHEIGKVI